jgi:hypothetical protein
MRYRIGLLTAGPDRIARPIAAEAKSTPRMGDRQQEKRWRKEVRRHGKHTHHRADKSEGIPMQRKSSKRKWSQDVTEKSDAMDLKDGVFRQRSARTIAHSLKRSAEQSHRRKASPFQSAMSMLNFYINRAGSQLSKSRRATLDRAKNELRKDFGREPK